MGVHGLWKLLEPAGKPVPVESLENKILAVDVSIWLYQLTKGFQTTGGGVVPNAHLVGLFNRICKLLYFRIRPVFVFDGGVPQFKKDTISARRRLKRKAKDTSEDIKEKLLYNLLKQNALSQIIGIESDGSFPSTPKVVSAKSQDDIFALPPLTEKLDSSSDDDDSDFVSAKSRSSLEFQYGVDIQSIDISSEEFKSLPPNVRHDILSEMQETRKQNSWAKIHEMPEASDDFSAYQLGRLLKRHSVQVSLDEAAKEMSVPEVALSEMEEMFKKKGLVVDSVHDQKFASDDSTHFLLVKAKKPEDKQNIRKKRLPPILQSVSSSSSSLQEIEKYKNDISIVDKAAFMVDSSSSDTDIEEYAISGDEPDMISEEYLISDDELALISDNNSDENDMSQEQILQIIKEQNKISNEKVGSSCYESTEPVSPFLGFEESKASNSDGPSCSKAEFNDDVCFKKQASISLLCHEPENMELKDGAKKTDPPGCESDLVSSFENSMKNRNLDPSEVQNMSDEINRHVTDTYVSESDSTDSDDFIEVSEPLVIKNDTLSSLESKDDLAVIAEMSDSDNSDLCINVSDDNNKTSEYFADKTKNSFEIIIKPSIVLEDDIFADIFANKSSKVIDESIFKPSGEYSPDNRESSSNIKVVLEPSSMPKNDVLETDDNNVTDIIQPSIDEKSDQVMKISYIGSSAVDVESNLGIDSLQHSGPESPKIVITPSAAESSVSDKQIKLDACKMASDIQLPSTSYDENLSKTDTEKSNESLSKIQVCNKERYIFLNFPKTIEMELALKEKQKSVPLIISDGQLPCTSSPNQNLKKTDMGNPNESLLNIQSALDREQKQLLEEHGKQERLGSTLSQQMILECQELLRLFGLPYIVAPMEAEAQCAFMDKISLTEGTITDDSDIWLFGGQKVYKNFFDNRKFVLHFRAVDIESLFRLTREQMIQLAMLVGSDYTVGIEGIGPVTALEILAYFSNKSNKPADSQDVSQALKTFREWIRNSRNKSLPLSKKLKGVTVSEGFPNVSVVNAYLYPTVDESQETFSWAMPNIDKLRNYVKLKFGWKPDRVDGILIPILRRLEDRNKQRTLDTYFSSKSYVPDELPLVSRRVQKAINQMKNIDNTHGEIPQKKGSKSRVSATKKRTKKSALDVDNKDQPVSTDKYECKIDTMDTADQPISTNKHGRKIGTTDTAPAKKKVQKTSDDPDYCSRKEIRILRMKDIIPQREQDRINARKRRAEAAKILKQGGIIKKKSALSSEVKSLVLSESSSDEC